MLKSISCEFQNFIRTCSRIRVKMEMEDAVSPAPLCTTQKLNNIKTIKNKKIIFFSLSFLFFFLPKTFFLISKKILTSSQPTLGSSFHEFLSHSYQFLSGSSFSHIETEVGSSTTKSSQINLSQELQAKTKALAKQIFLPITKPAHWNKMSAREKTNWRNRNK